MDASAIAMAQMLAQAMEGPKGASDLTMLTGSVISWNDFADPPTNQVLVNGGVMSDLRAMNAGVGTSYQTGDTVLILRRATQYVIMGRISQSGGAQMSRPASDYKGGGNMSGVVGTVRDLDPGAGVSPSVTVRVPRGGNCMVFYGSTVSGNNSGIEMGPQVSGASSMTAMGLPNSTIQAVMNNGAAAGPSFWNNPMGLYNYRDGVGNAAGVFRYGVNTFTLKYKLSLFNTGTSAQATSPFIFAFPY